jgi:hypothetical protein
MSECSQASQPGSSRTLSSPLEADDQPTRDCEDSKDINGARAGAVMTRQLAWGAFWVALLGMVLLAGYSLAQKSWIVFTAGALVSLSVITLTTLAGFIFGLPRYSSVLTVPISATASTPQSRAEMAAQVGAVSSPFTPSNNLEQISDWFTKLLLGAGLVQLGTIKQWTGNLVEGLASAFTINGATSPAARVVAGGLIALYGGLGFLFGYISTTLWYSGRLGRFAHRGES